jgi:hypothetical protein
MASISGLSVLRPSMARCSMDGDALMDNPAGFDGQCEGHQARTSEDLPPKLKTQDFVGI